MIKDSESVHIAWPHHGNVDNYFAVSLLDIVRQFPSVVHSYNSMQGLGLLAKSRNLIAKHFLDETDADWLFMVDSDQFIPIPAFARLLKAADSSLSPVPVYSGVYYAQMSSTSLNAVPLVFKRSKKGLFPLGTLPESDNLIDVDAVGAGALLIHRSTLVLFRERFGEIYGPDWVWFRDGPQGGNTWISEDLYFCERLRDLKIPLKAHLGAVFPHHKTIWLPLNES
jgi:hypothetical protein